MAEFELRPTAKYNSKRISECQHPRELGDRAGHSHHEILKLQGENSQGLCSDPASPGNLEAVGEFPHREVNSSLTLTVRKDVTWN